MSTITDIESVCRIVSDFIKADQLGDKRVKFVIYKRFDDTGLYTITIYSQQADKERRCMESLRVKCRFLEYLLKTNLDNKDVDIKDTNEVFTIVESESLDSEAFSYAMVSIVKRTSHTPYISCCIKYPLC